MAVLVRFVIQNCCFPYLPSPCCSVVLQFIILYEFSAKTINQGGFTYFYIHIIPIFPSTSQYIAPRLIKKELQIMVRSVPVH